MYDYGRSLFSKEKGTIMKKIIGNLLVFMVTFAVGIVFFIRGPVGLFKVTSGSMEPELKIGDLCIVDRRTDFSKLRAGEIVVFCYGYNNKACHRIVEKREGGYITKGDANPSPDVFLLTKNNYYGKVAFSI